MKTLEQFIKDNEGKFLEVAGSSNAINQCVDCVNGYIRDVLGFPIIEWTNAIDFKNKAGDKYDVIFNDLNNPNLVPDVGDIVVYDSPDNIGHICICIRKGTALTFGAFEENWPVGSPCKSVPYKKYVIGSYKVSYWLKPRSGIINDMTEDQSRALIAIENFRKESNHGNLEGAANAAVGAARDLPKKEEQILILTNKVLELELQITEINKTIVEIKANFIEKEKEVQKWQKACATANANLNEQILKNEELDRLAKDNRNLYLQKNDEFNAYKLTEKENIKSEVINEISIKELISLFIKKLFIKK